MNTVADVGIQEIVSRLREIALALPERLRRRRGRIPRDPHPRVDDPEAQARRVPGRFGLDRHAAARLGELDRIVDQVHE